MDKFNKDGLEGPEWLDTNFLEDVLRQNEGEEVKITNCKMSIGGDKNHFMSIIYRIAIDYLVSKKTKHISLILKTVPPKEGFTKELLGQSHAFETEIKMYSKIIPRFHKILRDIGDDTILGARMLYYSLDPIKMIILEDITKLGYDMTHNHYLEPHEIDFALEKICRWHAISFKLIKENDESIKELQHGVFNLKDLDIFFNNSINGFATLLNDPQINPIYSAKFEEIKQNLVEKTKNVYQLKGDLCVLNHGDFHVKNMMVKYGENKRIEDLILLDFQFCVAAPMVVDLMYLLYATASSDCRDQRDKIIYKYYTLFADVLNKLGYSGNVPTLIDIHREMMFYKEFEIIMLAGFLPFMFAATEEVEMGEEVLDSVEIFQRRYKVRSYIQEVKKLLPRLLYKGYLD